MPNAIFTSRDKATMTETVRDLSFSLVVHEAWLAAVVAKAAKP